MKLFEILNYNPDPPLMEMANLFSNETGIEYPIWIGRVGGHHGPRVKVSNVKGKWMESDNFVIDISETPKVLTKQTCKINPSEVKKVLEWIKINYDDLMTLWWMFERGALTVHDDNTGETLNYDDIRYNLKRI